MQTANQQSNYLGDCCNVTALARKSVLWANATVVPASIARSIPSCRQVSQAANSSGDPGVVDLPRDDPDLRRLSNPQAAVSEHG